MFPLETRAIYLYLKHCLLFVLILIPLWINVRWCLCGYIFSHSLNGIYCSSLTGLFPLRTLASMSRSGAACKCLLCRGFWLESNSEATLFTLYACLPLLLEMRREQLFPLQMSIFEKKLLMEISASIILCLVSHSRDFKRINVCIINMLKAVWWKVFKFQVLTWSTLLGGYLYLR